MIEIHYENCGYVKITHRKISDIFDRNNRRSETAIKNLVDKGTRTFYIKIRPRSNWLDLVIFPPSHSRKYHKKSFFFRKLSTGDNYSISVS